MNGKHEQELRGMRRFDNGEPIWACEDVWQARGWILALGYASGGDTGKVSGDLLDLWEGGRARAEGAPHSHCRNAKQLEGWGLADDVIGGPAPDAGNFEPGYYESTQPWSW